MDTRSLAGPGGFAALDALVSKQAQMIACNNDHIAELGKAAKSWREV